MNEDYLWNKTGEDAEIKKLENALKSLRYRENTAPLIPAKETAERKSLFKLFPFAVPVMACLVFAMLALGFWIQSLNIKPLEIAQTSDKTQQKTVQLNEEVQKDIPLPASNIKQTVKDEEKTRVKRRLNKVPKLRPRYVRIESLTAQKAEKADSTNLLTKEEKYAYDQLIKALAITSSQLKIVKDKIHGIENRTAAVKTEQ